jgi:phage terminase large subunit-like protein
VSELSELFAEARALAKRNKWDPTRIVTLADARAVLAGHWFDKKKAAKAARWFDFLRHADGRFAGKPFQLLPWQRTYIEDTYGWQRNDGTRRFRTVYKSCGKKNGKSALDSGEAGYQAFGEGVRGAHVVTVAADWKQAGIIFEAFMRMVRSSQELSKHLEIIESRKTIVWPAMDAKLEAISSDAPTKEGWNLVGVRYDELHAVSNRSMWDVLRYSGAAWPEPLTIVSTTAGVVDETSVCYELYRYACQVRDGIVEDHSFYPLIFEAPPHLAIEDPDAWRAANPSLGVTLQETELAAACAEAKTSPARRTTFERRRLNRWVQQTSRVFELSDWDRNDAHAVTEESLAGRRLFGGLDLAAVSDLNALVWVSKCPNDPEAVDVFCRAWLPKAALEKSPNARLYEQWERAGVLTLTPGEVADYRWIVAAVLQDGERGVIDSCGADRLFQGLSVANELADEGVRVFPVGMGFASMAPLMRELQRLVSSKRLHHGHNPILRYCVTHLEAVIDPAGNMKPDRSNRHQKIDMVIALLLALDRYARMPPEQPPQRSKYEEEDLFVI